jgi:DNA-binding beta-propeller fold protein YncE
MKINHTYKSCSLLAIWIFVLLCACSAIGVASEPRAFLLDAGDNSVVVLNMETAAILGTVSFEAGNLKTMIQIPHSKRLAVFDQGPGKGTLRYGWHPDAKASMSFVDMDSMKVTSRLELGWGIGQVLATDDGKGLAVVCPGYTSQKPEESLPAEVVLINTETSQIRGRFPVKPPVNLLLTPDNRTLITFTSAWHYKDRSRTPEVQFADFETAKVLGKLTPSKAVTSAELSADGQYLYLLDPGEPSTKVEKNVNGFLTVVSVSMRSELSAIDVGSAPRGLIHDSASDRILILSDTAPAKKRGETDGALHVFKGAEAVAVTPVAYSPALLRASPDGAILYVVGPDCVSAVDPSSFKIIGEIDFEGSRVHGQRRGVGTELKDFAITPDGKRAIVVFPLGDKVTVLDLEQKKSLGSLTTGRGWVRFAKAMAVGLENANAALSAQAMANETGVTQYYTVQTLKPASVALAVSGDSKFAYALNDQTSDLTVIDAQAATVLSKIGIFQGSEIDTMPSGNALAILGPIVITFLDTKTNEKIKVDGKDFLQVGGLGGFLNAFRVSPSGNRACALVAHRVICLDTSTLQEVGRQEHLKKLEMMLFEME